jgi:prefoldin subunit 5
VVALGGAFLIGCGSVPKSVKGLIEVQDKYTQKAAQGSAKWTAEVKDQVAILQKSVEELDATMQSVQTEEAKYALLFSSPQNLQSKSGIDSTAAAYMVGKLYLTTQDGFSSAVKDQFAASEKTLVDLSAKIAESWKQIQTVQKKVSDYSKTSEIAAIDVEFLSAVVGRIPGSRDKIDALLARTKELDELLDSAAFVRIDDGGSVARGGSAMKDLIVILEQLNSKAKGK